MLMIGLSGKELLPEERGFLKSPAVGGVILFTRNFESREQVTCLIADIRAEAGPGFLLAVDQEGGPVQRFRPGFTALPPLSVFGARYELDPAKALADAEQHAFLMASEMLALGLDLSFAPCIDLKRGNRAIGERAFHEDPAIVAAFAAAYVRGMHRAGMAATIKHFPGHGSVLEDTHFDAAVDPRSLDDMLKQDLYPFTAGIAQGAEAVMMAHVSYPAVAPEPAGYSPRWIKEILREQFRFQGVVISDDIGMAAAESAGGIKARIDAHLDAGCDLVLVCPAALVAEAVRVTAERALKSRSDLASLLARRQPEWDALTASADYLAAQATIA